MGSSKDTLGEAVQKTNAENERVEKISHTKNHNKGEEKPAAEAGVELSGKGILPGAEKRRAFAHTYSPTFGELEEELRGQRNDFHVAPFFPPGYVDVDALLPY